MGGARATSWRTIPALPTKTSSRAWLMRATRSAPRRYSPAPLEMRFQANENFPGDAIGALRADGHEVAWVRGMAPGTSDAGVLEWAAREARILLAFDKDVGELAHGAGL